MGIINEKGFPEDTYELFCLNTNEQINTPEYTYINKIVKEYYYLKDIIMTDKINELRSSYNFNTRHSRPLDLQMAKNKIKTLKEWIKMVESNSLFPRRTKKLFTFQLQSQIKFEPKICTKEKQTDTSDLFTIKNSKSVTNNHLNESNSSIMDNKNLENVSLNPLEEDDKLSCLSWYSDMAIYTNIRIESAVVNCFRTNEKDFKKKMINGTPKGFIASSWIALNYIPSDRQKEIYYYHLSQEIDPVIQGLISRDLSRTFPLSEYSNSNINYKEHLFNVMKAFASLDQSLGYCQGMNFIAGFLLIITDFNEKDTFFLLIALFSETFNENPYSIRGFFIEGFPLLLYFKYLFSKAFEEHLPKLHKHFEALEIPLDVWVNRWLQTLFTIILPLDWCCRVWDCIFIYGMHFIIKFSLILTQVIEKDLLSLEEESDVLKYLNEFQKYPLSTDSENLSQKCTIDHLIHKAIKLNIMSSFHKEKYIKDGQCNFDTILYENKIVYDLTLRQRVGSPNKNKANKERVSRNQGNDLNKRDQCNDSDKSSTLNKKSLTRPKFRTEIIIETNLENYDEDIDEESDNILSSEIDLRKSLLSTSNKIMQNLRKYDRNFFSFKSDLDTLQINHTRHRSENISHLKTNLLSNSGNNNGKAKEH